jgi:hypothetical protein
VRTFKSGEGVVLQRLLRRLNTGPTTIRCHCPATRHALAAVATPGRLLHFLLVTGVGQLAQEALQGLQQEGRLMGCFCQDTLKAFSTLSSWTTQTSRQVGIGGCSYLKRMCTSVSVQTACKVSLCHCSAAGCKHLLNRTVQRR